MSDEAPATAPATVSAPNPVVAGATQALAIKQLGETVAGVKRQVKTLWIAVGVLGIVTVVLAVLTLVPGLRLGMMGGGGNFQRGQFSAPAGGSGQSSGRQGQDVTVP